MVQGMSSRISQLFEGLGSSTLTLQADTSLEDRLRGKVNRLRLTDVDELRYRMDGISHITPMVPVPAGQVTWGSQSAAGQIFGTTGEPAGCAAPVPAHRAVHHRAATTTSRRRVVVLGDKIRKDLKMPEQPGRRVRAARPRVVQGDRRDGAAWRGVRAEPGHVHADALPDGAGLQRRAGAAGLQHHLRGRRSGRGRQREAARDRADPPRAWPRSKDDPNDFQVQASDSIAKTFSADHQHRSRWWSVASSASRCWWAASAS